MAFSEFIPLRGIAGAVTPIVRQFRTDMVPGDGPGCVESSDDLAAELKVVGHGVAVREFGRTVLQAAPTGYSAVVLPDGQVVVQTALGAPGLLRERVLLRTGLTPYASLGDVPFSRSPPSCSWRPCSPGGRSAGCFGRDGLSDAWTWLRV